jgi:hypothetical protein
MQTFYNFTTKTVVDPLANLKYFYVNPYMPDNMKLLGLRAKLIQSGDDEITTSVTKEGHVITLFSIEMLVPAGTCAIKWTEPDKFCIDNRIWCKIVGDDMDTVRVDTVRW